MTEGILYMFTDKNYYTKELNCGELKHIDSVLNQARREFPKQFLEMGTIKYLDWKRRNTNE